MIFFTRPISMILMGATFLMVISPALAAVLKQRWHRSLLEEVREAATHQDD